MIVAAVVLFLVGEMGYSSLAPMGQTLYSAITAIAVVASAVLTWHFSRARLRLPTISQRAAISIGVIYALTWAFAVPAVTTEMARSEIAIYKRLKAEGDNRVWDAHPRIGFFASFPIAPAIILTYHEYQVAGLWGEGSWDLSAWYGVGVYRIVGMRTWIS